MSVGAAIDFIIKHNVLLIEVLVGIILVTIIFLAFRAFFSRAQDELGGTDAGSIEAIEKSLKKILESTTVAAAGPSPEALAQMEELKATLAERTRLLEEMQEQLKSGTAAGPAEGGADVVAEKMKLETRMKELEAKLAEYEIISEDIADLSMYKEENSKLKKELDVLKAGGAVAAPAAASAPAPASATAPAEPAPVAEAAPADMGGGGIDDDIMAEFARAVEEQKAAGSAPAPAEEPAAAAEPAIDPFEAALSSFNAEETAPVTAPPTAPEEPAAIAAAVPEPAEVAAPAVAEVAPLEPAAAPEEAAIDLGEMNLEAMVAEADDLAANAPADAPAENALDASLDADKLAAEALHLTKEKEDEQLMDQFEDFVKKGAS